MSFDASTSIGAGLPPALNLGMSTSAGAPENGGVPALLNLGMSTSSEAPSGALPPGLRLGDSGASLSYTGSRAASVTHMAGITPGMGGIGVVIPDFLFFAGEREVNYLPNVQSRRITAFMSCAIEVKAPRFLQQADLDSKAARFLHLQMNDDHRTNLQHHFKRAFRYLDRCRSEGRRVMVYCRQGQSRSASIVAAYLMREKSLSFEDALIHLRQSRKADPNFVFLHQLDAFQRGGYSTNVPGAPSLSSSRIGGGDTSRTGSNTFHHHQQQSPPTVTTGGAGGSASVTSRSTSLASPQLMSLAGHPAPPPGPALGESPAASASTSTAASHQQSSGHPWPSYLANLMSSDGSSRASMDNFMASALIAFRSLDPNASASRQGSMGPTEPRLGSAPLTFGMLPPGGSGSVPQASPLAPMMASAAAPPTVSSTATPPTDHGSQSRGMSLADTSGPLSAPDPNDSYGGAARHASSSIDSRRSTIPPPPDDDEQFDDGGADELRRRGGRILTAPGASLVAAGMMEASLMTNPGDHAMSMSRPVHPVAAAAARAAAGSSTPKSAQSNRSSRSSSAATRDIAARHGNPFADDGEDTRRISRLMDLNPPTFEYSAMPAAQAAGSAAPDGSTRLLSLVNPFVGPERATEEPDFGHARSFLESSGVIDAQGVFAQETWGELVTGDDDDDEVVTLEAPVPGGGDDNDMQLRSVSGR